MTVIALLLFAINTILLLPLFGLCFLARRITGTYYNPTSLLSGAWCFYIIVPLVIGFGYVLDPIGILYIIIFISLFGLTTICFDWKSAYYVNLRQTRNRRCRSSRFFRTAFWMLVSSALLFHLIDAYYQGYTSSIGILEFARAYAERRYAGALHPNVYEKLGLLASFGSAVLGGFIFSDSRKLSRKLIILTVAMLPSVFVMLLQSAKGLLFLAAAYFFGAWVVANIDKGRLSLPKIRIIRTGIVMLVVFVLVMLSFIARFGWHLDILKYYLASYSAGHLFAFTDWMVDRYIGNAIFHGYDQPTLDGGFYTFMGIYHALGGNKEVPLGIYDEFLQIPGLLTTNIYTIFRGLISDFGLIGSLLMALLFGMLSNLAFYNTLLKGRQLGAVGFILIIGMIYQSYAASSLTWVSVPTSFVLVYVIFVVDKINFQKSLRISVQNG